MTLIYLCLLSVCAAAVQFIVSLHSEKQQQQSLATPACYQARHREDVPFLFDAVCCDASHLSQQPEPFPYIQNK